MRRRLLIFVAWPIVSLLCTVPAHGQQSKLPAADRFERPAGAAVPVVLCIDEKPTTGGQPSTSAYAKAAASGFRSVLTLRSAGDGVEPSLERFMVERNKMRYFNIAVAKGLPRRQQVDEFLRLVRDKANHPMLLNCGFAERVAPLMMIFRIVEQGWSEERALEEARQSGIKGDALKKFARDYLGPSTKKPAGA